MKKYYLILLLLSLTNTTILAQTEENNCFCCSENYNQFNFWVGEWNVYNTNNKLVGTNSISKNYANCLLTEKWVSTGKNKGTSTNFYNKNDNSWNQLWIDNTGYVLKLKGNFINGSMVLKGEIIKNKKGPYYNQISWTENNDGSVTQLWETYNTDNLKISTIFEGIYKKKLN